MKGNWNNQKRKKLSILNEVMLPDKVLWILVSKSLPKIERNINSTQLPPMVDCTPNQTHAMTTLLMTGHNEPQIPNDDLHDTGNEMWYALPTLAEAVTKQPHNP